MSKKILQIKVGINSEEILQIIDPRLENQYSLKAALKYCLCENWKPGLTKLLF